MSVLALVSDFGYRDPYVGIMKSVLFREAGERESHLIDLGHDLPPQSVSSAAYVLASAWAYLPPGCTVLSVVDPGVGSARRELIAACDGRVLVTPDNGTVTLLERRFGPLQYYRAAGELLHALRAQQPSYSTTFDGRDLFSPLAGRIAAGGRAAVCGEELGRSDVVLLEELVGAHDDAATVVHIDHFGNIVLSLHIDDCRDSSTVRVRIEAATELSPADHYAAVGVGEPLAYWGSAGYLELAVRNGSAARSFGLSIGDTVQVTG
jgi:hypothetical protein